MENKGLNEKIINNVRNRIVVSNLESEERMKISKKKQIISIAAVCMILLTGSFVTVNAATDGKLVDSVKHTIKTVKVRIIKNGEVTSAVAEPVSYDSDGNALMTYQLYDSNVDAKVEGKNVAVELHSVDLDKDLTESDATIVMEYDYQE